MNGADINAQDKKRRIALCWVMAMRYKTTMELLTLFLDELFALPKPTTRVLYVTFMK